MHHKRILSILTISILMFTLAGCSNTSTSTSEQPTEQAETIEISEDTETSESQEETVETPDQSEQQDQQDTYPQLAVKEPDVIYHADVEAVTTYTYTDEWYNSFLEMTGDEFNNTSKSFVNAVIQTVLEDRQGDKGIDVVNSWNDYRDLLDDAGVWESMKEDARADNASDTAPAVNPVQSNTSTSSGSSSKNNNSSSNNNTSSVAPSDGDNFDNQGYLTPEEEQAAFDAANKASGGMDITIDPDARHDSGASYIDDNGQIHFD